MNKSSMNPPSRVVVALLRGQGELPRPSGQIWARGCRTKVLRVDYRPSATLGGEVTGNFGAFHGDTLGGLRLSVTCDLTACALRLYCLGLTSSVFDPFGRV